MSIKLICKPEFFDSRLKSHLGLNITTEPGTTYFLCNNIEEVPTFVSSQDVASHTSLSGQQKVTNHISTSNVYNCIGAFQS